MVGVDERSEIFILQQIERGFSERVKLKYGVSPESFRDLLFCFFFRQGKKKVKMK